MLNPQDQTNLAVAKLPKFYTSFHTFVKQPITSVARRRENHLPPAKGWWRLFLGAGATTSSR